jgi:hypothetical protein
MPDGFNQQIKGEINNAIRSKELEWKDETPSDIIAEEFAMLLESSQTSPRVKSMMRDLYAKTKFQVL